MTDLYRAARAAEQAAYAAGTHLQASRSRLAATVVTHETPGDAVAAIEREALTLVRDVVRQQFPDHAVVGSDRDRTGTPHDAGPQWIVDPIDGLANYLRGYPQYAVSIALLDGGLPLVGVVYDPCRNEFFGAIRGHGAVLNGEPMRGSDTRTPAAAMAATVFPRRGSAGMPRYIAEFARVLRGFGGVRRSGSTALELAYLAAGRIDAFWAHDVGEREVAAGLALLHESGARTFGRDGRAPLATRSLLACAPALFEPFLSLLAES